MQELNDIVTSLDDDPIPQEAEQGTESTDEQELPDISAGSEPETDTKPEEAKNGLQERFNKLTAEKYAEKRRADEFERKLQEFEAKQTQVQALPSDLTAPLMPEDTWDNDQMRKYHSELNDYYRKVAQHEARSALSNTQAEQGKALKQVEQQKVMQAFGKRAVDAKIDMQSLQDAGNALFNAGLNQDLQMLILEDEAGPKLTMYLAQNPELANELIAMPTYKAAIRLAVEIKAKALSKMPKTSRTPNPIQEGKPGSMREQDEFERKFKGATII